MTLFIEPHVFFGNFLHSLLHLYLTNEQNRLFGFTVKSSLALYSCAILYNYYDLQIKNCYESKMSKKEYIIKKLALKREVIFF